jgi:lysophospholipase L1-like esterase
VTGAAEPLESRAEYSATAPGAVFFVGDSITFGWRDEDLGGWPTRLIGALPSRQSVTAYNLGVRGDTSEDVLARWRDEVERRRQIGSSTVIVFAFGANDAKLHPGGRPFVPLESTRRNTADILKMATGDHRVLFIGPAPVEEDALARVINPDGRAAVPTNHQVKTVSSLIAAETAKAGVPFFDLYSRLADEKSWFDGLRETDGIHPPGRGHDLIARLIGAWQPWTGLFPESVRP